MIVSSELDDVSLGVTDAMRSPSTAVSYTHLFLVSFLLPLLSSFLLIYFCRSPVGKIFNQLLFFTNLLSITAPAANIKIAINCDVDNTPTAPLGSFLKNSIRKRPTA